MNAKEMIKELQKLPEDIEVRCAIDKGRGRRSLYPTVKVEHCKGLWAVVTVGE